MIRACFVVLWMCFCYVGKNHNAKAQCKSTSKWARINLMHMDKWTSIWDRHSEPLTQGCLFSPFSWWKFWSIQTQKMATLQSGPKCRGHMCLFTNPCALAWFRLVLLCFGCAFALCFCIVLLHCAFAFCFCIVLLHCGFCKSNRSTSKAQQNKPKSC